MNVATEVETEDDRKKCKVIICDLKNIAKLIEYEDGLVLVDYRYITEYKNENGR